MKKQLLKKLSVCLPVGMAFIVTAMMFSASANAQIVYTDVIPDSTSTGTYNLDLNNDGTTDFAITHSTTPWFCLLNPATKISIMVTPSGTNQVADYSGTNATKMALNANINASVLTWNNSVNQLMASAITAISCTGFSGQWFNAVNGYLGLKLISGGNTYYGWARLNTSGVGSFTIKDYAYNSIPNQPILAGQTTVTGIIENSFASSINIYPNPATNHLTIALGNNNKKVEVTIADITGKIIYSTTASETQKIEVNTQDFVAGIYVVQIQSADFIGTRKLVITK